MKKFVYIVAGLLTLGAVACNDADGPQNNYGDLKVKRQLEAVGISSLIDPERVYSLEIDPNAPTDTTYMYATEVRDTTFDANGEPMVGPDGEVIQTITTEWVAGKITAKYHVYKPIELPTSIDTIAVKLVGNVSWNASVAKEGLFVINAKGNGDSNLKLRTTLNRNKKRARTLWIVSGDSLVMMQIPFVQKGEKD